MTEITFIARSALRLPGFSMIRSATTLCLRAGLCLCLSTLPLSAATLVVNGDFEAGNTGFDTDFVHAPGEDGLVPIGASYAIGDDPNFHHPSALTYGDHTTGSGLMLIANGVTPGGGDTLVWEQTVSVNSNSDFDFSFYLSSWYFTPFAEIEALINGVSLGTVTAPNQRGEWEQSVFSWSSGIATMATLQLFNTSEAVGGNDFAIDDIALVQTSLTMVPLPAALPLLAGGLSLLGLLGWRRRRIDASAA